MDNNMRNIYSEVDAILKHMEPSYVQKIPKNLRDLFEREKNADYIPNIDSTISISEHNFQRKTLAILASLDLDYWCDSEEEKQHLIKLYTYNDVSNEAQKRKQYNPDELFVKSENISSSEDVQLQPISKENFFQKIWRKFIKLFSKENKV